ncbi:MAG TPA: DHA2 family efflux MFS transporter permease subunit [Syntrophorhabdaceae bacterium]|nr:DHA2 family efflux MFS transporter permease subunit [Syntrophorhabdaceae bacterium]
MDGAFRPHNKWLITVTVMTGTIMASVDTSIVNVALPSMRGTLGATIEEIAWVSTGYISSCVIIMPLIAFMSSRFGRKRFCIFSVLLFTCASMLCGLAWNLPSMITFRIIQGLGGGTLIPISQAILRETFPSEEQGVATGIYGIGTILGPALGPTLGGFITDNYSWPWIFYINVPIGIINILLVTQFIQDPPYLVREKGKFDVTGLFFLAAGLGTLQILLERGNEKDWLASNFIKYLAVAASVSLVVFIWRELTTDKPAVDLKILKDTNFASATAVNGVLGMGLLAGLFAMPLFLQQLLGFPATDSGLALLPRGLAMAIVMPVAGRMYNRLGPKVLVGAGLFVSGFSFYQFSRLSLATGYWDIFWPQFYLGAGFGLVFVSLATAGLSTIEKPHMTAAVGLFTVVRQLSGSVGIALAATFLTRGEALNRAILIQHVTPYRDTASQSLDALSSFLLSKGLDPYAASTGAVTIVERTVERQATMLAFNHVYLLITAAFVLSLPMIVLINDVQRNKRKELLQEGEL